MHVYIFYFSNNNEGPANLVDQYQLRNMSLYAGAYRGSLVGENIIKAMQDKPTALKS